MKDQNKRCPTCRKEYPATTEFFYRDKSKKDGFRHQCKSCHAKAKAKYQKSPAGKAAHAKANTKYRKSPAGKAASAKSRRSSVSFKTYAPQLDYCDTVRKGKNRKLEVKCKKCGDFFMPTKSEVSNRIGALDGSKSGENNFYCSDECKQACPIFNKMKYSADDPNLPSSPRVNVDPEVREMVLEAADYKCEKCGSSEDLHVHHYVGATVAPMLTNDLDNLIVLCQKCHNQTHSTCDPKLYRRPECGIK